MPRRSEVPDPAEYNRLVVEEFRANHGKVTGDFDGRPLLLLTTVGAKSGREHITPLIHEDFGDRLIVGAAAGGQPSNPAWYYNIVANPNVRIEIGDEDFRVDAIVTSGEERAKLFAERCISEPRFKEHADKTDREIPIIVFPRPAAS